MTAISFTVPGTIVPWSRAGGKGAFRFTPKRQRDYMACVRDFASRAMDGRAPISGPVELVVVAIYPWPKSMSAMKRAAPGAEWRTSRPDAGNIAKLIEDSMNLIVYQDDAQIALSRTEKRYGDVPMLTVTVKVLAG